jgi:hypothetical protein
MAGEFVTIAVFCTFVALLIYGLSIDAYHWLSSHRTHKLHPHDCLRDAKDLGWVVCDRSVCERPDHYVETLSWTAESETRSR